MRFGIDKKVIFLSIVVVIIFGITISFYYIRNEKEVLILELDERAKTLLSSMAASSEYPVLIGDQEMLSKIMRGILEQKDVIYCEIKDKEGTILFQEGTRKEKYIREYSSSIFTENVRWETEEELILGIEEIKEKEEIGEICLTFSLASLREKLRRIREVTGLMMLIGIFFVSVSYTLLIRFILGRPLNKLVLGTEMIAKGNLNHRVLIKTDDEIGALAASFNRMTEVLSNTLTELEEKKRELEQILTNAPLGILYLDSKGTVVYENPAMIEIFGITEDGHSSLIGRRFQDLPRIKETGGKNAIEKLLKGDSLSNFEIEYKSPSGEIKNLELYGTLQKGTIEEIFGAVIMCLDLTDYRAMEEHLRQTHKMEAIGTLAGGIAHDFNNLLTGILGNVELALMKIEPGNSISAYLENVRKSSERAAELTAQLLAFGRRRMEQPKPTNLNSCIEEAFQILRRTINPLIEIKTEKDPNLYVIQADTGQMNQVLMNLMINACDAMPEGGTLTVKSENVIIDEEYCQTKSEAIPGKYIRLIVKDTGTGIPPENLGRIFEPFFTAKEIGKGTGLGLAMVYGIVKGHNGWIDVESAPNKGTSFSIYLPLAEVQPIVEDKETTIELQSGSETVLIVDDEEFVRNYGQSLLENFGYTVITASDGIKALETYNREKEKINLVILDLSMPHKSGRETLIDLLKINPSIKVIVSSGFDKSGPVQELLEMGAKGFVQKPYRMEEMLGVVRKILDE